MKTLTVALVLALGLIVAVDRSCVHRAVKPVAAPVAVSQPDSPVAAQPVAPALLTSTPIAQPCSPVQHRHAVRHARHVAHRHHTRVVLPPCPT